MKHLILPTFLIVTLISLTACTPDPPRPKQTETTNTTKKKKNKPTSKYPANTILGILEKEDLELEEKLIFSEKTDTGITYYSLDDNHIIKKIELNYETQPLNKKLNHIFFLDAIDSYLPPDSELQAENTNDIIYHSKQYNLSYKVQYEINKNDDVTSIIIIEN